LIEYSEFVSGKDIIVIGPAACVVDDCAGIDVNSYDLICRLNWHWKVPADMTPILGSRTDILYHCFNGDQFSESDIGTWKKRGFRVVARNDLRNIAARNDLRNIAAAHHKRKNWKEKNAKWGVELDYVDGDFFSQCTRHLGTNPSTGVLAIMHLLEMGAGSVSCVGFDFYQSLYWNRSVKNELDYINNKSDHKPKKQFLRFRELMRDHDNFTPIGKLKKMLEVTEK